MAAVEDIPWVAAGHWLLKKKSAPCPRRSPVGSSEICDALPTNRLFNKSALLDEEFISEIGCFCSREISESSPSKSTFSSGRDFCSSADGASKLASKSNSPSGVIESFSSTVTALSSLGNVGNSSSDGSLSSLSSYSWTRSFLDELSSIPLSELFPSWIKRNNSFRLPGFFCQLGKNRLIWWDHMKSILN